MAIDQIPPALSHESYEEDQLAANNDPFSRQLPITALGEFALAQQQTSLDSSTGILEVYAPVRPSDDLMSPPNSPANYLGLQALTLSEAGSLLVGEKVPVGVESYELSPKCRPVSNTTQETTSAGQESEVKEKRLLYDPPKPSQRMLLFLEHVFLENVADIQNLSPRATAILARDLLDFYLYRVPLTRNNTQNNKSLHYSRVTHYIGLYGPIPSIKEMDVSNERNYFKGAKKVVQALIQTANIDMIRQAAEVAASEQAESLFAPYEMPPADQLPNPKSNLDIRFIATRLGMSNEEVLETMVKGDTNEQRIAELRNLADELQHQLSQPKIIENEDLARGVVLLHRSRLALLQQGVIETNSNFNELCDYILGKFIKGYRPYIHGLVNRYAHPGISLTVQDLVSAGNLGFLQQIGGFDLGQTEVKVIGYCVKRIRGAALDEILACANIIQPPRNKIKLWNKHVLPKLDAGKTINEIAQDLGLPTQYIYDLQAMFLRARIVSLDELAHDHEEEDPYRAVYGRFTEDENTPEQEVINHLVPPGVTEVDQALEALTDRELDLIRRRFGFPPYEPHKLKEIGLILNVSESMASYTIKSIVRKLSGLIPLDPRKSHSQV